jgi:hypothetical protein
METTVTKSKITAVALTALTLAGSLAATSGSAQTHSHWGTGVGIGIAAGALLGAAVQRLRYTGLRNRTVLPSGHALRPLRKCAHDPGLQLLLIRWVGACPSILAPIWKTRPACPRPGRSLHSEFDH